MEYVFDQFPVLITERLNLIQINQNHLEDIYRIFSDENVTRYYNVEKLEALEDAQPIIDWFKLKYADKKGIRWGIARQGEKGIIGTIGINNFVWGQKATIGYDLCYDSWNKGYGSEALKAIVNFGFEAFGLNRVEAEVMPGNKGSEKILLKNGFTFEGTIRQSLFWLGEWYDMNLYSILKSDLETFATNLPRSI